MAEQPPTLRRGVVRRVDPLLNVTARFGERLAHLTRHEIGDLVLSLRHQVADAPKHIAASRGRSLTPGLETPPRRLDRALDVRGARQGKATNHVRDIGRVLVLEILTNRRHFTADEVAEGFHVKTN